MLYISQDFKLFSDKHYRNEAIDDLQRFIDEGNKNGKKFKLELLNDYAPYINILNNMVYEIQIDILSYCWNYGGGNIIGKDYDYEKWGAACREQSISLPSVQVTAAAVDLQKYIVDACRTECEYSDAVLRASEYIDLLHGSIGLCTEIGELQDQVKRFIFYGKDLDMVNIAEEIGDICYYIAIICKSLNLDWQKVFENNIEKLRKRYPQGFSQEAALNRNLKKERAVLERNPEEER